MNIKSTILSAFAALLVSGLAVGSAIAPASVAIAVPTSVAIMGEVWRLMTAHLPIGIPFLVTPGDVALMAGLALGAYAVVRVATARDTRTVPVTEVLKFRE